MTLLFAAIARCADSAVYRCMEGEVPSVTDECDVLTFQWQSKFGVNENVCLDRRAARRGMAAYVEQGYAASGNLFLAPVDGQGRWAAR